MREEEKKDLIERGKRPVRDSFSFFSILHYYYIIASHERKRTQTFHPIPSHHKWGKKKKEIFLIIL